MGSQGRFHGSVEVEHASGAVPYGFHPEAFGTLDPGKWGSDWQDGMTGLAVNQTESLLELPFDPLKLDGPPEVAREA